MFFINWGKKIFRVVGIAVGVLLGLLFLLMIICSAAFSSSQTVNIFGFNLFICESEDYESVPAGSAVIVSSCAPYDLEEGNLVLYSTDSMDKNAPLSMGYYSDFKMNDGVYYLSLVNGEYSTVISESALIGRAGWCSPFLGAFITFSKTPWGIFVMAVLPCALLLLLDVIRVKSAEKPIPEVIPLVKNAEEEPSQPQFSVSESGSASFRRSPSGKPTTADSVLFTYNNKKPKPASAPSMSDKDVLSLLNAPSPKAEKTAERPFEKHEEHNLEKPSLPAPVAAKRYIDNTVSPAVKPESKQESHEKKSGKVSGKTAELPELPKKQTKRSDAFFAQSDAPQIGRGYAGKQSRSIIDLEDALAAAPARNSKPESSRRSADILASKNRRDLITEDDDSRDKSRYEVDDILAGIEHKHQK